MVTSVMDKVVQKAWDRAEGKCECTAINHYHRWRCSKSLYMPHRGLDEFGGWEVYFKNRNAGLDNLDNYEICCFACYREKSRKNYLINLL